ncbi:hypothetical protein Tco_0271162 [Tanacetum coccineum]
MELQDIISSSLRKDMKELQQFQERLNEIKEECNKNIKWIKQVVEKIKIPESFPYRRSFQALFGEEFTSFRDGFVRIMAQLEIQLDKEDIHECDSKKCVTHLKKKFEMFFYRKYNEDFLESDGSAFQSYNGYSIQEFKDWIVASKRFKHKHEHVVVNPTPAGMRHHHLHLYMNPEIKQLAIKRIQRISLTGFPAQSVGSSNTDVLDLPCLLVLITGTSQSRQHVDTSLIHIESRKSPTKSLFDAGSSRISIFILSCLLEEQLLEPALNVTVHCCGREFRVLNCYDQKSFVVEERGLNCCDRLQ